ncbi:MAG: tyrosine--tRNA ligase [Gemmatimonadetes bacterium]|nr:MAG: tyrosine--tRNA ligase [Gemmatimonadota bacterium]PYP54259.1 MAG: tyrosine--tRNA ligase [Gemmatimonadota bacterium]
MQAKNSLLDELSWRGMVYQHTDGLADALATTEVIAYVGFDPTAPSLHLGHLVPVMGLAHLQRAGHRPVALVGGGTGMIGDPSGRTSERQLLSEEEIGANSRAIEKQLSRFLDFSGKKAALMRDNAAWLRPLRAVEFMRDVGKHFTVNYMLAKESVQARIEGGISFTEFSYMLLQAYDFLELNRREGVTLQMGGSDQWGNITAGLELIRRVEGKTAHALTMPLVTTASGSKFGKTEEGAVWLDPARTSPYKFYQYWINVDDRDAGKYLRLFTLLPRQEIEALEKLTQTAPEKREAQQALARDVTVRVHGDQAARVAEEVSRVLFGKADPTKLSESVLRALSEEVPFAESRDTPSMLDALVTLKLAASKSAARRLIEQGGVYVNGQRASANTELTSTKPLAGSYYLLRKGAREYAVLRSGR